MTLITKKQQELSLAQVLALMEDFTYKPNWSFHVATYDHQVRIMAQMWVPDSTRPFRPARVDGDYDEVALFGDSRLARSIRTREYLDQQEVIKVSGQFQVPPLLPRNRFYAWLRGVIADMETHELDEWFKVKGVVVNDPHAKDRV